MNEPDLPIPEGETSGGRLNKSLGITLFLNLIMKLITIIRGEHRDINQKTSIILKCSSRSRCTKITDFPTLSNTSTFENPTLLYTWGL